jgi:hypothetical protein
MRRAVVAVVLLLGVALAVGTAGAKPRGGGGVPVIVPVCGTFTASLGAETVPFSGTLTLDRFLEADGGLALEGMLAADAEGLFEPLAVTAAVAAAPSVDPATGACTVDVGVASTSCSKGSCCSSRARRSGSARTSPAWSCARCSRRPTGTRPTRAPSPELSTRSSAWADHQQ